MEPLSSAALLKLCLYTFDWLKAGICRSYFHMPAREVDSDNLWVTLRIIMMAIPTSWSWKFKRTCKMPSSGLFPPEKYKDFFQYDGPLHMLSPFGVLLLRGTSLLLKVTFVFLSSSCSLKPLRPWVRSLGSSALLLCGPGYEGHLVCLCISLCKMGLLFLFEEAELGSEWHSMKSMVAMYLQTTSVPLLCSFVLT